MTQMSLYPKSLNSETRSRQLSRQPHLDNLPNLQNIKMFLNKKSSTTKPSYLDIQRNIQIQMRQNLHQIINKSSYLALRRQIKTPYFKHHQEDSKVSKMSKLNAKQMLNSVRGKPQEQMTPIKVMGCHQNVNNLSQLWALVPDKVHAGTFFIYHIQTNLALKVQNEKLMLASKGKSKQFMFNVELRHGSKSLYDHSVFIKSSINRKSLSLKGILTLVQPNYQDQCQQFYFKKVGFYQPEKLADTYILRDPQDKDYCLGINRDKQQINYQKIDYSLEQRWRFSPSLTKNQQNKVQLNKHNQIDKIKQSDIKLTQGSKLTEGLKPVKKQKKSKLQELDTQNINIVTLTTQMLVKNLQKDDCYEITNVKLQKSLSVIIQKGVKKLSFGPNQHKRQWKIQCDGFSMKIKHHQHELYLDVENQQIVLTESPKYWEVFDSYENKQQKGSSNQFNYNSSKAKV